MKIDELDWRKTIEETPDPEREVLTKMKHGYLSGFWDEKDYCFRAYYFTELSWDAAKWAYVD